MLLKILCVTLYVTSPSMPTELETCDMDNKSMRKKLNLKLEKRKDRNKIHF